MNKRTFLKLASSLVATPAVSSFASWLPGNRLKNWAGNLTYSTGNVFYPDSIAKAQENIRRLDHMKALGTRHCFNDIADSAYNLVSTKEMNKIVSVNEQAKTVTVEAGIKYGELAPVLQQKGFALHNLASLPHISVAGACTTATHGSGIKNGNLATAVTAIDFISADGNIHALSRERDGEAFNAVVVGLGAIGVITRLTLQLQPAFTVKQYVYEHLPLAELKNNFDAIMSAGYSVSLFTDWQSDTINEVWVKAREEDNFIAPAVWYGAKAAVQNMHPIAALSAENCTEQMGVAGPWHERLPHFKMGFTPSSGVELQAEFFVARQQSFDAIMAVKTIADKIGPHLLITEIRTIAADELWLSPCYKRDSVAIHFTLKQDVPKVMHLLPQIEKVLEPFHPKPHWGKLFTLTHKQLQSRYEKMNDFVEMVRTYDPKGKFRNAFLNRTIYGS